MPDAFLRAPLPDRLALAVRRHQGLAQELLEVRLLTVGRKVRIARRARLGVPEAAHQSGLRRIRAYHPGALAADVFGGWLLGPDGMRPTLALHGKDAPVNFLWSTVLFESRLRASAIFPRRPGQSRIMGASRSLLNASAS